MDTKIEISETGCLGILLFIMLIVLLSFAVITNIESDDIYQVKCYKGKTLVIDDYYRKYLVWDNYKHLTTNERVTFDQDLECKFKEIY